MTGIQSKTITRSAAYTQYLDRVCGADWIQGKITVLFYQEWLDAGEPEYPSPVFALDCKIDK